MASGALLRAALTTVVYEKSLVLSQQARVKLNNGKLLAHLSTDISRIGKCSISHQRSTTHHLIWLVRYRLCMPVVLCNLDGSDPSSRE